MSNGKYSAKQFIKAIPRSGGIISTIAQRVGCDWHTAKKYIAEFPTVQAAYDEECQRPLDLAESIIYKNIEIAYKQAVELGQIADSSDAKWLLTRKGKDRGYVERQQIHNINIDVTELNDDELERIANGEEPLSVVGAKSKS